MNHKTQNKVTCSKRADNSRPGIFGMNFFLFMVIIFAVTNCNVFGNEPEKYFFTHMEVGYMEQIPPSREEIRYRKPPRIRTVLPVPEYSGPYNTKILNKISMEIAPGLEEEGIRRITKILNKYKQKGLFMPFPYYAERHAEALKEVLKQGHLVGIHMHENWQKIVPAMTSEKLTAYIKSEKNRVERAVGKEIIIFSYGPGLSLDLDTAKKIEPPDAPQREEKLKQIVLTKNDVKKLFGSVANAGYKMIQIPKEYEEILPSGLQGLFQGESLFPMAHTFEWHTRTGLISPVFQKIEERIKHEVENPLPE